MTGANFESEIERDFRLPIFEGQRSYYLLVSGPPVVLASQQIRAMNLAWALRDRLREGIKVGVIGGGAAGVTFAAAAAALGANVSLFEARNLMHLQLGSWHRPLHPQIYSWPNDTAYRPVSHLPILGWSSGPAHEVAREILSKFRSIEGRCKGTLCIKENCRAVISETGVLTANGIPNENLKIIVLAVGFGVEIAPSGLPLNSYWRTDALDQSFLADQGHAVIVGGAGDGALIDLVRSCVQDAEQAPFYDKVLALTENYRFRESLQKDLGTLASESERAWGAWLNVDNICAKNVDAFLKSKRRENVQVIWLHTENNPFERGSLPINRFLVSRLFRAENGFNIRCVHANKRYQVNLLDNGRYQITIPEQTPLTCNQAILRWGYRRHPNYSDLPLSISGLFEKHSETLLETLNDRVKGGQRSRFGVTRAWLDDKPFSADLREPSKSPSPTLRAEFITVFKAPDPGQNYGDMVYRIRIWLEGLSAHLTVRYDLHPEEENRPLSRVGIGARQEQWLNTRNDYTIRIRTSDGYEWNLGSVLEALRTHYEGGGDAANTPIRFLIADGKDSFAENKAGQTVAEAMSILAEQSAPKA